MKLPTQAEIQGQILRETRERINRHRKVHKQAMLTLRDIEKSASVALGYVSEIELGKKQVSEDILRAMLPLYGLCHSELLRLIADRMEVHERAT